MVYNYAALRLLPKTMDSLYSALTDPTQWVERRPSAPRGSHLLLRGKLLYIYLAFWAEARRLGVDIGQITIGRQSLEDAVANRSLRCLLTNRYRPQQAHLVPNADIRGWHRLTAWLQITMGLPFALESLRDYLESMANLVPLTYEQHQILDSDQAAWFPVDAKNLVTIEERRFIRLYRRFKEYGRQFPLGSSYAGKAVGELIEVPARFGKGKRRTHEYHFDTFLVNREEPWDITRNGDTLQLGSQSYYTTGRQAGQPNVYAGAGTGQPLPSVWTYLAPGPVMAVWLWKALARGLECEKTAIAGYFCRVRSAHSGQAMAQAFDERPACLGPADADIEQGIEEMRRDSDICRRFPEVPPDEQTAADWAETGRGVLVPDEDSSSEVDSDEEDDWEEDDLARTTGAAEVLAQLRDSTA